MPKKLAIGESSVICGVCSGIAEHTDMDVSIVRLMFFLLLFTAAPIGIIYLVLAMVMPKNENEKHE